MIAYKTALPPLTNGDHYSYLDGKISKSHSCIYIRGKYKIVIIIHRLNWTRELFYCYYYPNNNFCYVDKNNIKVFDKRVKNTNSLEWCGREQVEEYFHEFIKNPKIKVVFSKKNNIHLKN
jgi:hypothetical protein